jgi:hypothetical protein
VQELAELKAAEFTASLAVFFHRHDDILTVLMMAPNYDLLL